MSSISSDAIAARCPVHSVSPTITSLLMRSSFFCASPWTFAVPALPSAPMSAPRLTWLLMIFTAVATALSSPEKSPVRSELLLRLALDIRRASAAERADERAAADLVADDLHGRGHRIEQPGKVTGRAGMTVLGLRSEEGRCLAFVTHAGLLWTRARPNSRGTVTVSNLSLLCVASLGRRPFPGG